jgi:Rod binding domain-containing protein
VTSFNPSTSKLGDAPITLPTGERITTAEQREVYESALEFERYFVQQLLKPMEKSGSLLGEGEEGSAGMSGYRDMAQDQLTQAVLDGGGLGLASTIYGQMAEQAGILEEPATPTTDGAA